MSSNSGFWVGVQTNTASQARITFSTRDNGVRSFCNAAYGSYPTDGSWNHIAVTRQGTTGSVYVNGQLVYTNTSLPAPQDADVQAVIGAAFGGLYYRWDGALDAVRFYREALTAQQVQDAYSGN